MKRTASQHLAWILAAAVLGFLSAFVLGDLLALPRRVFLVPHLILTAALLYGYARWSATDLRGLWTRRLAAGLVAAGLVSVLLVMNVLGQAPSARPEGARLWLDLLWLGLAYGAADALLLSVLPLVAAWRAARELGWTARWPGRAGACALGLLASALVTGAYHLGYAEFRGPALGKAIVGNTIMSAAQIASASPVASVGSHVAMHVAAVLHGPDSTVQLPPHR